MKNKLFLIFASTIFLFSIISFASALGPNLAYQKVYTGATNTTSKATYPDNATLFTDGNLGSSNFADGYWFAFWGFPGSVDTSIQVNETIDLGGIQNIGNVNTTLMTDTPNSILLPYNISVWTSTDNTTFTYRGILTLNDTDHAGGVRVLGSLNGLNVNARYVRFKYDEAKSQWLFISEGQVGSGIVGLTTLNSPSNNSASIIPGIFNATVQAPTGLTVVNATLTLWNGTIFYSNTTINISGATNDSVFTLYNLPFQNFSWNVYGCWGNGVNANCSYATNNYTIQIKKFIELSQFYSSPVMTGSVNSFILASRINNTLSPTSAFLNYNGTNYSGSWNNFGTYYNFSIMKNAAFISSQSNISFYWIITLSDGSQFFSNTSNQTVNPLPALSASASACGVGLANPYTFYLYNESDATTAISGTFNYNFMYGSVSNSTFVVLAGNITSSPSFNLCFNNTLTNLTLGYGQISYTSAGMDQRTYYLFSGTNLTSQQHNVSLFDLPSTFTSAYKFLVEDNLLNLYVGKYIALIRWYPGLNQYSTVDMGSTDTSGNTILHAVSNDVDYRFGVYEPDGTLDYMAPSQRLTCSSNPCEFTLKIPTGAGGYSNFQKIQYTFTFTNATNTWLFTYSDPTGTTQAVNLTIYKTSGTNVYPVCSQLTNGAAGAVSCDTTGYTGDLYGIAFQQNGGLPVVIAQLIENVGGNSPFSSTIGLWLTFLIALPIAFLFIMISPILGIVGGVIALVPAMYFGSVTWAVIGAFAVLGGIAIHMMRRSAP